MFDAVLLTRYSASLEFLRLVTPPTGGGKSIIDRCMTDEHLLQSTLLEDIPDEHRPDDEWIAARLKVDNEFRTRMAASLQRKFKRKLKGGIGTGYSPSDEVWCHYRPTEEELQKWIEVEGRGEKRIDEDHAMHGGRNDTDKTSDKGGKDGNENKPFRFSLSDAEKERTPRSKTDLNEEQRLEGLQDRALKMEKDGSRDDGDAQSPTYASPVAAADGSESNDAPAQTWLGLKSDLRDGPQQD